MKNTYFRLLVLLSLFLCTIGAVYNLSGLDPFTEQLIAFRDKNNPTVTSLYRYSFGGLGILGYVLFYLSHIGLLFFWKSARVVLLISFGILLITTVAIGPIVKSGINMALNDLSALVVGVIVALMYSPLITAYFNKESNKALQPTPKGGAAEL